VNLLTLGCHGITLDPWHGGREFLRAGLEADEAERFRRHERTGRPLGPASFLERIEKTLGRVIRPHKRGPKPKSAEK